LPTTFFAIAANTIFFARCLRILRCRRSSATRPGEFTGKVDEPDSAPADFDLKTATTAVRFNGCYFFEPLAGG
jgi:hypothetical protein